MGRPRIGAVIALEGEREFQSAVSNVDKELKKLGSEGRLVSESFKGQEKSMEALRAKEGLLQRTLEAHKKKVSELDNGLRHANEVYARTGDRLGELEQAYEEARQRMSEMEGDAGTSGEALEAQRKEVERLHKGLQQGQAVYQRAQERVMQWETRLNAARAELLRTSHALEENARELEQAGEQAGELGDEAGEAEGRLRGMRGVFEGSLAAGAVEAMAGKVAELGQAAAETAKEMQEARQQAVASTGAAAAEAGKYGRIMEGLYRANYGESFSDIGEALGAVRRNLGELSETDLGGITEDAITLRDTFGMEYQEQMRAVKMLTDTFGISARQAYSLIAQGAQSGINKNDDLLDVINEYSVHYKNMGVSAEGFFNSLANGTAAGTFSVDKLGDAYKEFGIRVKDTAASTTEGFTLVGLDADAMRAKFAAGGQAAKAATDEVLAALFSMDDQVAQNQAGVALFGTMWEDMGADAIKALTDVDGGISMAKATMESIKEVKYADIGSQIAGVAREIEMKLAGPLEKEWLPAVRDGLSFVSDNIDMVGKGTVGLAGAAAIWKLSQTQAGAAVLGVLKKVIYTRTLETAATEAQTLATKASTAAHATFNAVAGMNPIGKIALAVGAAAGAYRLLQEAIGHARQETINSDKGLVKTMETVKALTEEVGELERSMEEAKSARASSLEGIQAEYGAYEELAGKLVSLSEKEGKTNGEKALMKAYIDQLNEAMPELNLAIDENTGKLDKNGDSIRGYIRAMEERLAVEAQESMLGEILQEQMQAEIALAKAQGERESAAKKLRKAESDLAAMDRIAASGSAAYGMTCAEVMNRQEDLRIKTEEYKAQLAKLDEGMGKARDAAKAAEEEYGMVAKAVSDAAEESGRLSGEAAEGAGAAAFAAREAAEAYGEMESSIQGSLDGVASIFDEFNAGQEKSVQEMLGNLESQEKGLKAWRDDLKTLAGAAGQGMTEEFFQYLVQMGPQGANAVAELAGAFRDGEPEFREICGKYKDVLKLGEETAEQITQEYYGTGLDAARGVKKGIEDGAKEVEAAASSMFYNVARTGRQILQIKSPSRKMRDGVGVWIPRGVAAGIRAAAPEVEKEAVEMVVGQYKKAAKKAKELPLAKLAGKKGSFGVSREAEGGTVKAAGEYSREVLEAAAGWLAGYKKQRSVAAAEEAAFWEKAREQMKKGTAAYKEATKNMKDARKASSQETLSASDRLLSQYKVYYNVSAKAEVQYWDTVRKQFKKGTDERIEADSRYYEAKQALNSQLESLNEEYVRNCADVQERLGDGIKSLTDAYKEAVEERAGSIYSSFGLFDEFRSESQSGAVLLHNLKTQVAGFADWELKLEELAARGLPDGLLGELKEMGPEASAALHALNSLTDSQLEEYARLWQQKKELSESQAVKDMEPMRRQTQAEIDALVKGAQAELGALKKGYQEAVAELGKGISASLKKMAGSTKKTGEDATAALVAGIKKGAEKKSTKASLQKASDKIGKGMGSLPKAGKEIGARTLEGILEGLSNKKAMQESARELIDRLKKEIQAAAEIHSPSALFRREVGVQVPAGIGEGIEEGTKGMGEKGAAMVRVLLETYKEELARQAQALMQGRERLGAGERMMSADALAWMRPAQPIGGVQGNSGAAEALGEMLALMQRYIPQIAGQQIVMDSGQVIGALGGGIGSELAMMSRRARR